MTSITARLYLRTALLELTLGYVIGAAVWMACDFCDRVLHEYSSPVLRELFFAEDAFREVMLSTHVLVHVALYLCAKCAHALLPIGARTPMALFYILAAVFSTALWRLPLARGEEVGGAHLLGFYVVGLPLLVLCISTLTFMRQADDQIARAEEATR